MTDELHTAIRTTISMLFVVAVIIATATACTAPYSRRIRAMWFTIAAVLATLGVLLTLFYAWLPVFL